MLLDYLFWGQEQNSKTRDVLQSIPVLTLGSIEHAQLPSHCAVACLWKEVAVRAYLSRSELALVHQDAGREGADVAVVLCHLLLSQLMLNQLAQDVELYTTRQATSMLHGMHH